MKKKKLKPAKKQHSERASERMKHMNQMRREWEQRISGASKWNWEKWDEKKNVDNKNYVFSQTHTHTHRIEQHL